MATDNLTYLQNGNGICCMQVCSLCFPPFFTKASPSRSSLLVCSSSSTSSNFIITSIWLNSYEYNHVRRQHSCHSRHKTLLVQRQHLHRQHSLLFSIRFGFLAFASRTASFNFDSTCFPIGAISNVSVVKTLIICTTYVVLGIYTRCTLVLGVCILNTIKLTK